MWHKLECLLRGGHVWRVLRENRDCNLALAFEHPMAACDADCEHCGEQWRDFERHLREWHRVETAEEIAACERAMTRGTMPPHPAWDAALPERHPSRGAEEDAPECRVPWHA